MQAFGPPPVCAYVPAPVPPAGSQTPISLAYVFANTTRPSGSTSGPSGWPRPSASTSTGLCSTVVMRLPFWPSRIPDVPFLRFPSHALVRQSFPGDHPRSAPRMQAGSSTTELDLLVEHERGDAAELELDADGARPRRCGDAVERDARGLRTAHVEAALGRELVRPHRDAGL